MERAVKIGIVGIGGYGRLLLDLLHEEQEKGAACVEVAVVKSPELEAEHLAALIKNFPEVRVFQTLDEVVRSGVELDLMILPVGIGAHKEMTEVSLKAGWNVLVEKPLAGSVEEAEAIVLAAERSDRFVAVGYQDMYGPLAPAMKAAVLSGVIGDVYSVRVLGIWGRSANYFRRNAWAGRLVCDGQSIYDSPFNNAMAHCLNMALYLAGSDSESVAMPIAVEGSLWRAYDIESCDTASLCWQTDAGPDVSVFFSHASSSLADPELVVEGSAGTLHWKFQSHWEICPNGESPVRESIPSATDMRRGMIRLLLQKVYNPEVLIYTPRQALAQAQATALAHDRIKIRMVPNSLVRNYRATDEYGQVSDILSINGLEDAGQRFLEGNGGPFCLTERWGSDAVSAIS